MRNIIKTTLMLFLVSPFLLSCDSSSDKAETYYRSGYALYLKKDLNGACGYFKRALIEDTNHKEAALLLAKIYYFKSDDKSFQDMIGKYLDISSDNLEGRKLRARWYIKQKQFTEAKNELTKVLAVSSNDPGALYLLGTVQQYERNYSDAIVTFNKAFSNYTFLKEAHTNLDEIYNKLGLTARAESNRGMAETISKWEKQEK